MTFTEAAEAVLRQVGKPLHYKKITQLAIEQNLLSHVGKTPEVTMSTRLATLAKRDRGDAPIVRVRPGVFALRDWNITEAEAAEAEAEVEEADETEASHSAEREDEATKDIKRSPDERERAERLAAAAQLFPEEEDDDEPVFGDKTTEHAGGPGRRRRRRRRRGRVVEEDSFMGPDGTSDTGALKIQEAERTESEAHPQNASTPTEAAPAVTVEEESTGAETDLDAIGPVVLPPSEAAVVEPFRREERRELRREERRAEDVREELTGRDAADVLVTLLARREDRQPVPIRVLVDEALRSGRLSGEPGALTATLSAAARVDAARREARGERPRLRVVNGRVALVDWVLGPDFVRAETDALIALERLRDAARRQLLRRLNELPHAAFIELMVMLLERMGISSPRIVRRPGLPQGETHFAAVARRANEEIKTAVLIKRGGEIGRERVIDLRGSLHHYGPATHGWILTTGNILSGAREEAAQPGTAPITLLDGMALGRLFDEYGVGVRHASVKVPYLDFDLIDALRG